jgi:hypothetical protein
MSNGTDFSGIIDAINRLTDAVDDQTSVLRTIADNMDDAVDVEREKLEFLKTQAGETPTEDEKDEAEYIEFDREYVNSKCDCTACVKAAITASLKAHLDSIP